MSNASLKKVQSICFTQNWFQISNLMNRVTGREADCLWGPDLDLMVKAPPSLSNIQDLGAARRFRCFLGPRGILTFYF